MSRQPKQQSGVPSTTGAPLALSGMEQLRGLAGRRFGTKQHWWAFVREKRSLPPERLTLRAYQAMSPDEREAYDERRLAHAARFTLVTETMEQIHTGAMRTCKTNLLRDPGARRMIVVDGLGGLGKSKIVTEFGRKWELYVRSRYQIPKDPEAEVVPVAYATLPAPATIKTLNEALADFYEIPRPSKFTTDWVARKVREAAERCCTSLVILDDIHFLNLRTESHREVNDHLKSLANSLNATFLYAGIAVEKTGLLSEGKSGESASASQTRRRFVRYPVAPFSFDSDEEKAEWLSLLLAVEQHVVLMNARSRGILRLGAYLYERSGGFIGSVVELVRQGAALAIENGSEQLTEALLDEIDSDYASEQEFQKRKPHARRSKQRRMTDLRSKTQRAPRPSKQPKQKAA